MAPCDLTQLRDSHAQCVRAAVLRCSSLCEMRPFDLCENVRPSTQMQITGAGLV